MQNQEKYGEEVLLVEPRGIEPVPANERHGRSRNIFTLWFSANLEFATLSLGVLSINVFGLSLWQAVASIVIGTVLGALVIGFLTTFGYKWGIPQLIQSRASFGFIGNMFPALFNFIAGIGWYAVNSVLGVYALQYILPIGFLPDLIIMIALQAIVSVYGHNLIHFVERISALLLAVVFIIVTFYAIGHAHFNISDLQAIHSSNGLSGEFILSIGVSLSYMMGWMTFSSDYSRYLPEKTSAKRAFNAAFWGNVIPCVWLEVLGAILATIKPVFSPTDIVTGIMPHWMVIITMLAIILGTLTANVLNIYSGSLSLLAIDARWIRAIAPKRWVAALLVGILGGILSYFGGQNNYYSNYSNFLYVLAYWVSPWVAVLLIDYFFFGKGKRSVQEFYEGAKSFRFGFFAFLIGFLVSIFFFNQQLFTGPIAHAFPGIGDISYYVSFIVAAIVYSIYAIIRKNRETSLNM